MEGLADAFNGNSRRSHAILFASVRRGFFAESPSHEFQNPHAAGTSRPRGVLASKQALLGFDGFVDTIVAPVALRAGQGENFTPITTITEFGQRILGAAGKSTNIEFYPRMDKLGGNGPIMACALLHRNSRAAGVGWVSKPAFSTVAPTSSLPSRGTM